LKTICKVEWIIYKTFKIGQPFGLTELRSFLLVGGYPQTPESRAKSRSKSTSKAQGQELVAFHKSLRFIPVACLFLKAIRVAPAFITRTSTGDGAITHTIPTGMVVWLSVNGTAKAGWTVVRVSHPPHSTLKAPVRLLADRSRSFGMVGRLHGQA